MTRTVIGLVATLTMTVGSAAANEFEPALQELAAGKIAEIVSDPALIAAIQEQNAKHGGMDEPAIIALDEQWRGEVGTSSTPTIDPVLNNAVADMLRATVEGGEGLFTEIFVMDNVGLNVAASDVTSDYWQGDEAKWQQTYAAGAGAVHIGDVEMDESTQTYQAQVSVSIVDDSGAPVGAATFGVDIEHLE